MGVRRGREEQEGGRGKRERERKERKRRKKERESRRGKGERKREKRKSVFRWSELVGQEVKDVYSTRAMLQEIGILPTLVYQF